MNFPILFIKFNNMTNEKYKIGDIYFGTADGEDEALNFIHKPNDFKDFYYDYDNIVEKAMQPLRYLILGKKGAGKTLLGEYLNFKFNQAPNNISKIVSFNEFRMHSL